MSGTATAERNGAVAEKPSAEASSPNPVTNLPVDSYKEAAPYLRRPFTAAAVKFKVQATWEGGALVVAYIDARLVIERLNLVIPHLWTAEYEMASGGNLMWCHLTVDGITRRDVGEGTGKGLVSDSLKRAAVPFGIGVSLYAIPKISLKVSDGHLKQDKRDKYKLTPNGESRCRAIYEGWLDTIGKKGFGEPLDHGDAEGAVGDADVEGPSTTVAEQGSADESARPTVLLDQAKVESLAKGIGALKLNYRDINLMMAGPVGADALAENSTKGVTDALRSLSLDQATRMEAELARLAQDQAAEAPQEAN